MDRRTVLAITLCFMIYLGWQKFYLEPRLPHQALTQSIESAEAPAGASGAGTPGSTEKATPSKPAPAEARIRPSESMTLPTGTGEATIGDGSQFFVGWKLKSYTQGLAASTGAVDLPSVTHENGELELAFDDPAYAYLSGVQGTLTRKDGGVEWGFEDSNVKLTRFFAAAANDQQNYVSVRITAEFKKKQPSYAFVSLTLPHVDSDPEERDRSLVYFTDQSIERVHPKGISLKSVSTDVKYIGVTGRYFLLSAINDGAVSPKGLIQPIAGDTARVSMVYPMSGNFTLPLKVFFGPKELDVLRSVDPALDHTVDFGWFTIFAYPILKFLKFLYGYVGNYGAAIILLTVVLKLATYPLTYKSMKSMKEMAKLQPQLAKLREQYKDDKEALNREMLSMMKTHGYNPMAGCLPMLIQMPIFFALYRVLWSSIDLYHAPFAFYIHDLSARDPYYVTPVLLSLTMFVQQKVSPNTATDPAQQKMMQFMPLMFGAMMMSLPAGLTLYMLVNAIASIIQQLILNKKFDNRGPGSASRPALARA